MRKVTSEAINRIGYTVIDAEDATTALNEITDVSRIDAAFLDVSLPGGISGIDLANVLREIYPDIRILFTSGFVPEHNRPALDELEHDGVLEKPIQFSELVKRLENLFVSKDGESQIKH